MSNSNMTDDQRAQELSNARSKKSRYESQKAQKESKYNSNCNKINRLKATKRVLEEQKSIAKDGYTSMKNYAKDEANFSNWTGAKREHAHSTIEGTIVSDYDSYVDRIDDVLDAVNNEITRLQNENLRLNGDILGLASAINSLANTIRNLLN